MAPIRTLKFAGGLVVLGLVGLGLRPAADMIRRGAPVLVQCWHVEDGDWSSDTTCTRSPIPSETASAPAAPAAAPAQAAPANAAAPPRSDQAPSDGVWLEEDFSGYRTTEDLLRYPSRIWSTPSEDVGKPSISLDPSGPPVGGQSMRYTFRDRSQQARLCNDYTIGRNIKFPSRTREVWFEVWFRFSPGWETYVPQCRGRSSNGYKFLFARVPVEGRFAIIMGVYQGHSYSLEYPGGGTAYTGAGPRDIRWERITDGGWHLLQQHLRVSSNTGVPDGVMETRIDGVVLRSFRNVAIHPRPIYGLALGRNMNQGPTQEQSLWWGRVRVWQTDPGWGF